ncbi:MAG: hypothetical protein WD471_01000 [Candidatus Paceibacterota bacterium]
MDNQQNNSSNNNLNNLEANTMASDTQSIKTQGGNEPKPYAPQENKQSERSNPNDVFTPPSVPDSSSDQGNVPPNEPPQKISSDNSGDNGPLPPKKPGNKTFLIILVSIIVIGVAIAGYIILSSDNPEVEVPVVEEEVVDEEEVINEGEVIDEGEVVDEEVEEEVITEEPHSSLFSTPADSVENVELNPVDIVSIKQAIDYGSSEEETLREIVMRDSNGQLVGFSSVVQAIAPTVFTEEVTSLFNKDATFYVHSNSDGGWFGVVASLSDDANLEEVQEAVKLLEGSTNETRNFYSSNPGTEGSWADGSAQGVTTRYITFGDSSAAFNYGWSGNALIIGTSYQSFSEVVNRL